MEIKIERLKESVILKYSVCPKSLSNSNSKDIPSHIDHNEPSNDNQECCCIHINQLTENTDISKATESKTVKKRKGKTTGNLSR